MCNNSQMNTRTHSKLKFTFQISTSIAISSTSLILLATGDETATEFEGCSLNQPAVDINIELDSSK